MLLLLSDIEYKLNWVNPLLHLINFLFLAECFEVWPMTFLYKMQSLFIDVQRYLDFEVFISTTILIQVLLVVRFEPFNEFLVFLFVLRQCLFIVFAHALPLLHGSIWRQFVLSFDYLRLQKLDLPLILCRIISSHFCKVFNELLELLIEIAPDWVDTL